MEIRERSDHDPATEIMLVDASMRWALLAAAEVVGKNGLAVVLRQAKLGQRIGRPKLTRPYWRGKIRRSAGVAQR